MRFCILQVGVVLGLRAAWVGSFPAKRNDASPQEDSNLGAHDGELSSLTDYASTAKRGSERKPMATEEAGTSVMKAKKGDVDGGVGLALPSESKSISTEGASGSMMKAKKGDYDGAQDVGLASSSERKSISPEGASGSMMKMKKGDYDGGQEVGLASSSERKSLSTEGAGASMMKAKKGDYDGAHEVGLALPSEKKSISTEGAGDSVVKAIEKDYDGGQRVGLASSSEKKSTVTEQAGDFMMQAKKGYHRDGGQEVGLTWSSERMPMITEGAGDLVLKETKGGYDGGQGMGLASSIMDTTSQSLTPDWFTAGGNTGTVAGGLSGSQYAYRPGSDDEKSQVLVVPGNKGAGDSTKKPKRTPALTAILDSVSKSLPVSSTAGRITGAIADGLSGPRSGTRPGPQDGNPQVIIISEGDSGTRSMGVAPDRKQGQAALFVDTAPKGATPVFSNAGRSGGVVVAGSSGSRDVSDGKPQQLVLADGKTMAVQGTGDPMRKATVGGFIPS